jgi:hypothetical protein
MSQKGQMELSVTLPEGDWWSILDCLALFCRDRGDEWMHWQMAVSDLICTAIREAKAVSLAPNETETKETHNHDSSRCPKCGGLIQSGTDYILAEHISMCPQCGYIRDREPMSRQERMEAGDFDWLEVWDDPNDY